MIAGETKLGILGSITYHSFIIFLLNARTKCTAPWQCNYSTVYACRVLPSELVALVGVTSAMLMY